MWSDKISLKFTSETAWLSLGLENGHTFDAVVLGDFIREDGTPSVGFHVDCRYVGNMPEGLEAFIIHPENERHTYA